VPGGPRHVDTFVGLPDTLTLLTDVVETCVRGTYSPATVVRYVPLQASLDPDADTSVKRHAALGLTACPAGSPPLTPRDSRPTARHVPAHGAAQRPPRATTASTPGSAPFGRCAGDSRHAGGTLVRPLACRDGRLEKAGRWQQSPRLSNVELSA